MLRTATRYNVNMVYMIYLNPKKAEEEGVNLTPLVVFLRTAFLERERESETLRVFLLLILSIDQKNEKTTIKKSSLIRVNSI